MEYRNLQFEIRDHVGWLTLNRPDHGNAVSLESASSSCAAPGSTSAPARTSRPASDRGRARSTRQPGWRPAGLTFAAAAYSGISTI